MDARGSSLNVTPTSSRSNSFSSPPSNLDYSVGKVFAPDTPLGLKPLSRSPREILEKKKDRMSRSGNMIGNSSSSFNLDKSNPLKGMTPEGDRKEDLMDELKLFYTATILNMEKGNQESKMLNDSGSIEDTLVERLRGIELEVELLRNKVFFIEALKTQKREELELLKRDVECLEMVMKTEERKHVDTLICLQTKIKNCLAELTELQESSLTKPYTDSSVYSKVFPCQLPTKATNNTGGLLEFSNLFCLSGQLLQFCQGQYGSKLVINRIRHGTDPERNLVREELDLPRSLGLLLESGNTFFQEVVLALVEKELRTRVEVVGRVKRDKEKFVRLKGGKEFLQRLSNIVGELN